MWNIGPQNNSELGERILCDNLLIRYLKIMLPALKTLAMECTPLPLRVSENWLIN